MTKKKKKVLVAMSGGVDSSVAALLLKQHGYDCIGVFFVTWQQNVPGLVNCPWEQDVFDARRVCAKIGIPLYTFNFEEEYRKRVVEYFFREYQSGRTPNPDVMCNKEIKFNLFLNKATQLGADYIATGHYARLKRTREGTMLLKGKDPNKDQSYFLYTLKQAQLERTLFPIGDLVKTEVRQIAKKNHLPIWNKKDSQGICFLGKVRLRDFLKTRIPVRQGDIIDLKGNVLGVHEGVSFYTIGQRHGLKIGGAGEPYYVVSKNKKTNTLVVSQGNDHRSLLSHSVIISRINWIAGAPSLPIKLSSKIRYRQPDQKTIIESYGKTKIKATFMTPQRAATEGQSIVFYKGSTLVGGGVIDQINAVDKH